MKNKHSFFGLQIVCRSCFPSFVDWGGLVQKRQPGRADFGEVVRPPYPPISPHVSAYLRIFPISPHISAYLRISPISPHISAYPPSSPPIPHIPIYPASQHIPMSTSLIPSRLNNLINFIIFAI
nr:MAG TPA: hypothetical protein [Caudoviricetes sp.]